MKTCKIIFTILKLLPAGSGANLIIMDNPRHDPTLFREA
jgi:hypothetical protein